MLSSSKKTQQSAQDWFVVLNPLKSELERNRISKEIAKAFQLPVEEANDLVVNTPIILIDNLLHETALQLKQYFRSTQAEILVSNDHILKRRCYRTVWQTPPNLSFLHQLDSKSSPPKDTTEKLDQEEAIQEIRSWVQTEAFSGEGGERLPRDSHENRHFRNILEEDREKLLKESVGLKENMIQLHKALEKAQNGVVEKERMLQASEGVRKQREKEVEELRLIVGQSEEKYELLREEFRQTRQYFEEKIMSYEKKSEELLHSIEERDLTNKELLQEKQVLQKSFYSIKNDSQHAQNEYERAHREWESQMAQLSRELENEKKMTIDFQAKIQNLEEGKRIIQTSESRLMKELESQTQQAKQWEQKVLESEKEIRKIREAFEEQLKLWQIRLTQLEARERALENAHHQIHQLQWELEQREILQKKNQIHEQLAAKETRLKQLVKLQEKMESEIRDREEEMRKLLVEQEVVEREVIEAKQMQRHLSEKLKVKDDPISRCDLPPEPQSSSSSSILGSLPRQPHPEVFDD